MAQIISESGWDFQSPCSCLTGDCCCPVMSVQQFSRTLNRALFKAISLSDTETASYTELNGKHSQCFVKSSSLQQWQHSAFLFCHDQIEGHTDHFPLQRTLLLLLHSSIITFLHGQQMIFLMALIMIYITYNIIMLVFFYSLCFPKLYYCAFMCSSKLYCFVQLHNTT